MSEITECTYYVMAPHLNGAGRVFGGQIMKWIDEVAGITARRYCGHNIVTACVDGLNFLGPAYVDDNIVMQGKVTYVGNTSMEVRVCTYVEKMNGERTLINEAYLIEVALDERGNPTKVVAKEPETEEEKRDWEAAQVRAIIRKTKNS